MKCVPKINRAYWTCLILASIFGANAGDFVADVLHLGHLSGIPFLAAFLATVFIIEWISPRPSALYFWIAIIIIRASATNIGDVFHFEDRLRVFGAAHDRGTHCRRCDLAGRKTIGCF